MADLQIELFGDFRVAVGAHTIPDERWSPRMPAAVVKLLALAPGHRLLRKQVMDVFWPQLAPRSHIRIAPPQ